MSPSPLTLDKSTAIATDRLVDADLINRAELVAKLNKALYPVDRQEKFLQLQAEVETLFSQLQALQRNRH